jgi:integrase
VSGSRRSHRTACTADEARTPLSVAGSERLGSLYTVAIATGMRQGELLGLRWQDVDLDAGIVAVRHTLQRQTGELVPPKTERGRRTLQLAGFAVAALREQRRRQLEERLAVGRS